MNRPALRLARPGQLPAPATGDDSLTVLTEAVDALAINLTRITGIMPMSGRPFLWTRQKAGRLSGWRICSGSTRLMDAHPILNGSLKDIDVYDCEMSELDAIARDTGLTDRAAIGARQVGLVVEAKHID
jgi:hypothetical protein